MLKDVALAHLLLLSASAIRLSRHPHVFTHLFLPRAGPLPAFFNRFLTAPGNPEVWVESTTTTRRMSAHKKRTGLFTFLPRRPLLTLRPNRGFEIPNYNEPALALWLSTEQLEGEGLHENGRVNSMMDAARPWRRGWHPPLVPLAAGRPVYARQDFAHSREDECPTFHRHMAGDHPVNLQPYKYMLLIAVSAPFLMPLQTQTFQ